MALASITMAMNAQNVITVEENDGTTEEIEMPEGMTVDADSLLEEYDNKTLLSKGNATAKDETYNDDVLINRLAHIPTTIEMPLNNITRKFIDQYSNNLRSSVSVMLGSSNFYMPIFEEALEHYNLPLELRNLPVIESALRPTAVSRAGAVGLWQFMLPTAKRYGLEVNTLVDERRDPLKASYAAAHYLSDLYDMFGDWGLAIAAYNCGETTVKKALIRSGEEDADYWDIYNLLPKETRGYVPAFIAANYIMTYYCEHGITPMEASLPLETDTIVVSDDVDMRMVADRCGITIEELRSLNPQYRRDIVPVDYAIRLPQNTIETFLNNEDSIYNVSTDNSLLRRRVTDDVAESQPRTYTRSSYVSSGKSHYSKYSKKSSGKSKSRGRKSKKAAQSSSVTVKKGDTLSSIAKRNGTTVSKLKKLNGIKGSTVRYGKKIKVR